MFLSFYVLLQNIVAFLFSIHRYIIYKYSHLFGTIACVFPVYNLNFSSFMRLCSLLCNAVNYISRCIC